MMEFAKKQPFHSSKNREPKTHHFQKQNICQCPIETRFVFKNQQNIGLKCISIPLLNPVMQKIVRKGKIDKMENKNGVVNKFICNYCPNNYVGETKRPLFIRIE